MNEHFDKHLNSTGLTNAQTRDCYAAGRHPKTGRRIRTSNPTPLERQSKIVNWNKLMVTGASRNLQKVARDLHLTWDEANSLEKAILKIETLMVNKLAEDYEAFKATELFERGSKGGLSNKAKAATFGADSSYFPK